MSATAPYMDKHGADERFTTQEWAHRTASGSPKTYQLMGFGGLQNEPQREH